MSLRDVIDLCNYLTEKDLFDLYESAFNEIKKKFPLIDKKEAQLSQVNESIRAIIGDSSRYKDIEDLKNEIFTVYCRKMKGEIPEDMLKQFLDDLFKNLKIKIGSHPKIRSVIDSNKIDETLQLARNILESNRQISQCRVASEIQTPEGLCKSDFLTEGFVGKVRLVLGTHADILGKVNYSKVVGLVEKVEGDPEYAVKNTKLTSEVCTILVESFDHLPQDAKNARIVFSIILSKFTGSSESLESCELPSDYDELNFQAYITLATISLNRSDIESSRKYLMKLRDYMGSGEKILAGIIEGRILIEEYSFDEAINCFRKIINDADSNTRKVILFYMGLAYFRKPNFREALEWWNKLSKIEENRKKLAIIIGNMGVICHIFGDSDQALEFHSRALKINEEVGNREAEANNRMNMGLTYLNLSKSDEAIENFQKALEIFREIGNELGEAKALGNIAEVYTCLGKYKRALGILGRSLRIHRKIKNRSREVSTFANIGSVYTQMSESGRALKYFDKALELLKGMDDKMGEATILFSKGCALKTMGLEKEALESINRALDIFINIGAESKADILCKYILEMVKEW